MQRKTLDEHLGAFLPPLLSGIRLAHKQLATRDLSFVRSSSSCSLHERNSVNIRPICVVLLVPIRGRVGQKPRRDGQSWPTKLIFVLELQRSDGASRLF